ncbi:MAG: hypothetical protein U0K35_07180, partial [Prevotella sp.]|nr:hypothetical protein [Prevotella sp.]
QLRYTPIILSISPFAMQSYCFFEKYQHKMKEILKKTCTYQKIVVPLHPQLRNNLQHNSRNS